MTDYAKAIKWLEKTLANNDWPKQLYVTPGMFWDLAIAFDDEVEVDWKFEEMTEGFPFMVIGPTIIRTADNRKSATTLLNFRDKAL